jgi:ABC-type proline/glycine betaine transport system permease subunit
MVVRPLTLFLIAFLQRLCEPRESVRKSKRRTVVRSLEGCRSSLLCQLPFANDIFHLQTSFRLTSFSTHAVSFQGTLCSINVFSLLVKVISCWQVGQFHVAFFIRPWRRESRTSGTLVFLWILALYQSFPLMMTTSGTIRKKKKRWDDKNRALRVSEQDLANHVFL